MGWRKVNRDPSVYKRDYRCGRVAYIEGVQRWWRLTIIEPDAPVASRSMWTRHDTLGGAKRSSDMTVPVLDSM